MKKVAIIMGSDSDLPIVQKAVDMLKSLEIPYEVHIYSAHRTPVEARATITPPSLTASTSSSRTDAKPVTRSS